MENMETAGHGSGTGGLAPEESLPPFVRFAAESEDGREHDSVLDLVHDYMDIARDAKAIREKAS